MTENTVQFYSKDGYVYIYSSDEKQWYVYSPGEKQWFKFCPVSELPSDVKRQVQELEDKADILGDAV
jgi:hypothetical protein